MNKNIKKLKLKTAVSILFAYFILSCSNPQEAKTNKEFTDKLLDFIIENKDDQSVEIDGLYPTTIDYIPSDKDEKLVLAEKLKARGFKVTDAGRGNYPPIGVRIVSFTLKKDQCACEVSKIYYLTTFESTYIMKERISCKNVR